MIDLNKLKVLRDKMRKNPTSTAAFKQYKEALFASGEELIALASTAQDSIPSVKPWEQRMGDNAASGGRIGSPQQFMAAEIADWRAKGAAQDSAPSELPTLPFIERFDLYSDHGRTGMMGDDDGEYVLYSHHEEAMRAALSRPVVAIGYISTQTFDALACSNNGVIMSSQMEEDDIAVYTAAPASPQPVEQHIPQVVRDAIEATFEQRKGYMVKVGAAARALADCPQPVAKVLVKDWPACNPCCEYEDLYGGIQDCRTEGCSCDAAKESIARQRAASTPTTLTEKKE